MKPKTLVVFLLTTVPVVFAGDLGYGNSSFGFMPADISYVDAADLGVFWSRPHPGPFVWGYIEVSEGVYDWTTVDEYVAEAQGYNFNLLVTIWPFADWDQEDCHSYSECMGAGFEPNPEKNELGIPMWRCKPCNLTAYREFVEKVVERYDDDGIDDMPGLQYPIKYWEASNEPSMQGGDLIFFKGTAEDYFDILNATYQAVKESDSEATLLHAGMAGFGSDAEDFWSDVYVLGAGEYFDVANIHSIGAGGEGIFAVEMREFLDEHGINKSFWITEVQYSLWGLGEDSLTDDEWAQVIVRSFVFGLGNDAERLFYVALKGNPGDSGPELITEPDEKKPAYYAFGTMVEKIDNFTSVEKFKESQYKFTGDNNSVYVLWDSSTSIPDEITGTVSISDIYGNTEMKESSEIVLSDSPVYVEIISTCSLVGDYPPCGEVIVSEVIELITGWSQGQANLSDVIALITAWAFP